MVNWIKLKLDEMCMHRRLADELLYLIDVALVDNHMDTICIPVVWYIVKYIPDKAVSWN